MIRGEPRVEKNCFAVDEAGQDVLLVERMEMVQRNWISQDQGRWSLVNMTVTLFSDENTYY